MCKKSILRLTSICWSSVSKSVRYYLTLHISITILVNSQKFLINKYIYLVISSTPITSHQKNSSFTPMLLKTMELSYVARRSGMTPIILNEPHVSPLKPALKNAEQDRGLKRKTIQFKNPETSDEVFTPVNSCNSKCEIIFKTLFWLCSGNVCISVFYSV